jgi:hypothetical protein
MSYYHRGLSRSFIFSFFSSLLAFSTFFTSLHLLYIFLPSLLQFQGPVLPHPPTGKPGWTGFSASFPLILATTTTESLSSSNAIHRRRVADGADPTTAFSSVTQAFLFRQALRSIGADEMKLFLKSSPHPLLPSPDAWHTTKTRRACMSLQVNPGTDRQRDGHQHPCCIAAVQATPGLDM